MTRPGAAQRVAVWMLCRLLPKGFRTRQHAEWTGDLIALSESGGASVRWRYLFAAAWTLPALRAHARKPGVDRPHAMVPAVASPSVTMLTWVILIGLGLPVLSWLIAIPARYHLVVIPARALAPKVPVYPPYIDPVYRSGRPVASRSIQGA